MSDPHETRHSLIERACDLQDDKAWAEFVLHYRRFILYVLREMGVNSNDVEDLTQQILLALTRDLGSYDRSQARFRTWLSTVIKNAALGHFRRQKSQTTRLQIFGQEQSIEHADQSPEIMEIIEKEWTTYIASLAMDSVKKIFQGQAIQVFELGLEGLSAAKISEETGLSVASVYTLRKRVKKRLYLEIRSLTAELEP